MTDAVRQTLLARVYDVAKETPLHKARKFSAAVGKDVYFKREDLQPVNSFKLRGAYNKMASLNTAERQRGVIAASAGNHAQGVALSGAKLGISSVIVMPRTTPTIKVEAVKNFGGKVVLMGDNFNDAYEHSQKLAQETGRVFIHPFDDPLVIAGQGTIGHELLEQLPEVTHIFVPIGGGGLIAGIAQYVKELRPEVKIIGVEPKDCNSMGQALKAGKRITLDNIGLFADGVAVKQVGKLNFKIAQKYVDEVVTVNTDQICAAVKTVFEDTRSIVEPAGALATAAIPHYHLPKDAKVVAICSGANVTFERLQQIAERTLLGSGKEAMFSVEMPEEAGALQKFYTQVISRYSITEFNYRLNQSRKAHVLIGINVASEANKIECIKNMQANNYAHIDLSNDDLTKEHVRHMIGGTSAKGSDEQFYEIEFPEKPGALGMFLKTMGNSWNISAFHYRNTASDNGKVLLGFEATDVKVLEAKLRETGYKWHSVSNNHSLKLFLK